MSNMSYCRFHNTRADLSEAKEHIEDVLSKPEHRERERLIDLCREIVAIADRGNIPEGPEDDPDASDEG